MKTSQSMIKVTDFIKPKEKEIFLPVSVLEVPDPRLLPC